MVSESGETAAIDAVTVMCQARACVGRYSQFIRCLCLVYYEHQFFVAVFVAQDIEIPAKGHSAQQKIVLSASLFGHF
jgi:hypothetical protein